MSISERHNIKSLISKMVLFEYYIFGTEADRMSFLRDTVGTYYDVTFFRAPARPFPTAHEPTVHQSLLPSLENASKLLFNPVSRLRHLY